MFIIIIIIIIVIIIINSFLEKLLFSPLQNSQDKDEKSIERSLFLSTKL